MTNVVVIRPIYAIQKVIEDATQAQLIVLLNDVANFTLPTADPNSAKAKAKAVELSALVTASADSIPMAKTWLHRFVAGYPACELASAWIR